MRFEDFESGGAHRLKNFLQIMIVLDFEILVVHVHHLYYLNGPHLKSVFLLKKIMFDQIK